MKRGVLVTFEGTEGAGKSTAIQELAALLKKRGRRCVVTREPGGVGVAEKIRDVILGSAMSPRTELFLYEAARAEHLARVIEPALTRGDFVLCDRFTDSTLAYQGTARGIPWSEVKRANELATGGTKPDLVVWLDLPPATGLARAKVRTRFEKEGVRFQERVRRGFRRARLERPGAWMVLRSDRLSAREVAESVLDRLESRRIRSGGKNGQSKSGCVR